ncbi:MAG TPA: hypothetical protein VGI08_05855 [Diaminobutyricibacter sp.]|jgi:hypothetical protein
MSLERYFVTVAVQPLRPVRADELESPGVRGSAVTGLEFSLICVGAGAASFFLANVTGGGSFLIGLVLAPAVVTALSRQRGARRVGATGVGLAAALATVAVWIACLVALLILGPLTGASSPV